MPMTTRCDLLQKRLLLRASAGLIIGATLIAACALNALGARPLRGVGSPLDPAPPAGLKTSDLIVVAADEPWLLAVACPLVGRLRHGGGAPLLLAVSRPPSRQAQALLERIAPRWSCLIATLAGPELVGRLGKAPAAVLQTGSDPLEGCLLAARRFWGRSSEVIVAPLEDPGAMVLGSALAAHLSEPLLIYGNAHKREPLLRALEELQVERILLSAGSAGARPSWTEGLNQQIELLDSQAIQRRLIAMLKPERVQNIVLARVPDAARGVGRTAWLAPYLSVVRGAPVVLSRSSSAAGAEASVARLTRDHGLRPRTVTILADYESIGTKLVKIPVNGSSQTAYRLSAEPCAPTNWEQTATVGVGRIPFGSLADASALFVRGLAREHLLAGKAARMLMVANLSPADPQLPLCEIVSRVTAKEFKNFAVYADEFYRQPAGSPEVLAAAAAANLMIYEGHVEQQNLITDPYAPRSTSSAGLLQTDGGRRPAQEPPGGEPAGRQAAGPADARAGRQVSGPAAPPGRPMDGLPVVILQTCDSLKTGILQQIHESGGVGLVASGNPIHSGSGSAFVKALSDGVLYRDSTVGEALRDAQNYFFCLHDLKSLRGRTAQPESQRVALSFRLWGDPELRVFPQALGAPRRPSVSAAWDAAGKLIVSVPAGRFSQAQNEAYLARMFPGSEAAGMVKRLKHSSARRLAPVYFFRLAPADGFAAGQHGVLARPGGRPDRAVFRVDPSGRFVYVLYFPETERAKETFVLEVAMHHAAGIGPLAPAAWRAFAGFWDVCFLGQPGSADR